MTMSTVAISGNTYPVREKLKALGGKWDAGAQVWYVPANKADEAKQIVANAPGKRRRQRRWVNPYY